ncbi:MAG: AbrB/MazE/SpoVT family DNA-binding domain-containing protein [Dehalococcoidia bacterium]
MTSTAPTRRARERADTTVAARMTSKGQLTVPKRIRDRLGLRPGDSVEFTEEAGVVKFRKRLPESPFGEWRGYAKWLKGQDPDKLLDDWRGR